MQILTEWIDDALSIVAAEANYINNSYYFFDGY